MDRYFKNQLTLWCRKITVTVLYRISDDVHHSHYKRIASVSVDSYLTESCTGCVPHNNLNKGPVKSIQWVKIVLLFLHGTSKLF